MQTRFYTIYMGHEGEQYDYVVEASTPKRAFELFYNHIKDQFGLKKDELENQARGHLLPIIMTGKERVLRYDWGTTFGDNHVPSRSDDCIAVNERSIFEDDDAVSS